jgi:choline-sulfatase
VAPKVGAGANLLLVTLDTVRADHLGSYGDREAETPVLDRLAAQGIRFQRVTSTVPLTLPSHTSLMTGLLPPHHGVRNNGVRSLRAEASTLAEVMSGAGYRTGAFVGAFVLDHQFGLDRGFQTYDDAIERPPGAGWLLEAERTADQVVDHALSWLRTDDARPFFLWVHLYDAHAPYTPPSPYRERHADHLYDGEIAFDDAQVGRLLAAIAESGRSERTLVAIAADHGESLGEHGELTHGLLLYEPVLAVPWIIRGSGLPSRVVTSGVSLVDVAPTLAGLLDLRWPTKAGVVLDGRDLSAAIKAGTEPPPVDLYSETHYPELFGWSPLVALRRRDAKFIDAPRAELYDLSRDAGETKNLLVNGDSSMARTAEGFTNQIAALAAAAPTLPSPAAPDAATRARLASLGYAAAPAAPHHAHGDRGLDPKDGIVLFERFQRAHAELQAGKTAVALADLEPLIKADPGNPVFRTRLAQSLRESGQVERSLPIYREVTQITPQDAEAWYNLAAALEEAGQLSAARKAVVHAIELDPGRAEAHNTLGIVLLGEHQPDAARQEFAKAAQVDPRNPHAWNNLGNVLRGLRRPIEAERAYRQAIEVAPHDAEPLNGMGTLEVDLDRPADALPFFDRALILAPGYHEVRFNRSIALQLAGHTTAAIASYREFLQLTAGSAAYADQRKAAEQFLGQLLRGTPRAGSSSGKP